MTSRSDWNGPLNSYAAFGLRIEFIENGKRCDRAYSVVSPQRFPAFCGDIRWKTYLRLQSELAQFVYVGTGAGGT